MYKEINLHKWIIDWKRSYEELPNLLFYLNIKNIVEYLCEYIDATKSDRLFSNKSYEKELLGLLSKTIDHANLEIEIIKSEFSHEIMQIKQISSKFIQSGNKDNIDVLCKLLIQMNKFLNSEIFHKKLEAELIKNLQNNEKEKAYEITTMILRFWMTKFSEEKLRKFPHGVFAKYFFEKQWPAIKNNVENNVAIQAELDNLLEFFVKTSSESAERHLESKALKKFVRNMKLNSFELTSNSWYPVQQFIEKIESDDIFNSITYNKSIKDNTSAFAKIVKSEKFCNMIDLIFYEGIKSMNTEIIKTLLEQNLMHNRIFLEKLFFKKYSQVIKSEIRPNAEDNVFPTFEHDISISVFYSICNTIAIIIARIIRKELDLESIRYRNRIIKYIRTELKKEENYKNKSISLTSNIIHQFQFALLQIKFFSNLLNLVTKKSFAELQKISVTSIQRYKSEILEITSEGVLTELSESRFRAVPNEVSNEVFEFLIKKMFEEFNQIQKFRVIVMIGGLDCSGEIFKMGNVTFYDGRKYDFGEQGHFDQHFNSGRLIAGESTIYSSKKTKNDLIEYRRNSGRAFVEINAPDQQGAIQSALIKIRESLSTLVYYSTATRNHGFKPDIPLQYIVKSEGITTYSWSTGEMTPENFQVSNKTVDAIKFYNNIIERKSNFDGIMLTGFLWYEKAKWEKLVQDKFLALWIGLEQIISSALGIDKNERQTRKQMMLESVPKLTITWRDSDRIIQPYLKEIAKTISENPEILEMLKNDPRTRNYQENYAVLLECLDRIYVHAKDNRLKKSIKSLQKYLTDETKEQIRDKTEFRMQMEKFKIARLNIKRNLIVHEGNAYTLELEAMTKPLAVVFERTMDCLLQFHKNETLDEIIFEIQKPFEIE